MKVLIGERPALSIRRIAREQNWGQMFIYETPKPYPGEPWGFDNGAYLDWKHERAFDEARYSSALDLAVSIGIPYMVVVPDLVGRGLESLDFSLRWVDRLPRNWPLYLAIQDGMRPEDILPVLAPFDGLFLGGTDRFKRQARDWCLWAHHHGKRFHFARAGTETKIKLAMAIEADSIDSSFPLWNRQRLQRLIYLTTEWRAREPQLDFTS